MAQGVQGKIKTVRPPPDHLYAYRRVQRRHKAQRDLSCTKALSSLNENELLVQCCSEFQVALAKNGTRIIRGCGSYTGTRPRQTGLRRSGTDRTCSFLGRHHNISWLHLRPTLPECQCSKGRQLTSEAGPTACADAADPEKVSLNAQAARGTIEGDGHERVPY